MKHYDYLIAGTGLFGATFAYLATRRGKRCLAVERRQHTGGNIHCSRIAGINVHQYGPHIFHTSDKEVWDFVNSLVTFNRFTNSPLAVAPDGKMYNLPFNMNTFHQLWGITTPDEALAKLSEQRISYANAPANLEEQALSLAGRDIYRLLIKGYTEKQWGRKCSELPAFIIRRLPLRMCYDNNYFNDLYQGIPIGGYNELIEKLLEGTDVMLGTDFLAERDKLSSIADKIVFTGRIDEYYGFCHGMLQYRTVRFDTNVLETPNFQGNAVVNYTSADVPYTRIIEHKHFESFGDEVYDNPRSVVSYEYPEEWHAGLEPFYPVNDERNNAVYARYKALADAEKDVIFGGRLAEYKYYDMAPLIRKALDYFNQDNERIF